MSANTPLPAEPTTTPNEYTRVEHSECHPAPVRAGGADDEGGGRWEHYAVPESEDGHADRDARVLREEAKYGQA